MGFLDSLFGSKTKIYVSSTCYNLAGDETDRVDYLKTTVVGAVLKPDDGKDLGETITDSYLDGPGIKLRGFSRWARDFGYDSTVGFSQSTLTLSGALDETAVAAVIPHDPLETVCLQTSSTGPADYGFWVDKHMVENHPDLVESDFSTDFDDATKMVTILFADGTSESFYADGFDPAQTYLYVSYFTTTEGEAGDLVLGEKKEATTADPAPDTTDWTVVESGDPNVWERTTYKGIMSDGRMHSLYERLSIWAKDSNDKIFYQIDTRDITHKTWSPLKVLIYAKGSGNAAFDALFNNGTSAGYFLPYIPIRLNNKFISDTYLPTVYKKCKRALKKATGAKYDTLVDKISDNKSLGDIDYAYVVFGVSLNVKENACKRYIYEFFQEVMKGLDTSNSAYHDWKTAWLAANTSMTAWSEWFSAQSDPNNPLHGAAEPARSAYPASPTYSIRIFSGGSAVMNYDMTISWSGLVETQGTGKGKTDAKVGELWFEKVSVDSSTGTSFIAAASGFGGFSLSGNHIRLWWQVDEDNWRRIDIYDLFHRNMIYGGKSVDIKATDALDDADESGFIIPIHETIYRRMPLTHSTQMATACCFVVFNCYQVVKQKWYETFLFKILLFVVVIFISVATGGLGGVGLLGSAVSVGEFFGLSGIAGLVVGTAVNYLAAMVFLSLVQMAATALFGKKLGALIGAIAGFVLLNAATSLINGGSMMSMFDSLTRADNILKLTIAAGNGYASYLNVEAQEISQKTTDLLTTYKKEKKEIEAKWIDEFGLGHGEINPLDFVDVTLPTVQVCVESVSSFFERTLMVGSDVADFSFDLIHNFSSLMLSTDLDNAQS